LPSPLAAHPVEPLRETAFLHERLFEAGDLPVQQAECHRDQQPDDESAKDKGSQFSCLSRQNHMKTDEGFAQNGGEQGS